MVCETNCKGNAWFLHHGYGGVALVRMKVKMEQLTEIAITTLASKQYY